VGARLGQHFLFDPSILSRIADAAVQSPDDVVLEIGPGKGTLTRALAARAARVVAIEADRRLAAELPGVHAVLRGVVHEHADELEHRMPDYLAQRARADVPGAPLHHPVSHRHEPTGRPKPRPITRRWISLVPSPISSTLASR
jgi:16S rRNA A1518/A1519 N6-dimethyltransferase RsmA/KsgA/DIM1 with predicted DNA glycosylase/AP lyase activity